jgi:general secretion pathway protein C
LKSLLRRFPEAIDLVVITICAVFIAHASATLIDRQLMLSAPPLQILPWTQVASVEGKGDKSDTEILRRSIFCSSCPSFGRKRPGTTLQPHSSPQATTLPLRLLAIMFAPPPNNPRWSMAIIRDDDDKTAGPYMLGASIRQGTISQIGETRVFIEISGRKEYLDLVATARLASKSLSPSNDPMSAELDRAIRKIAEDKYEIQRQALDSLLGNVNALSKAVRIVPESRRGTAVGFRLFNVRPDGPFAKIGLQNGDIITAINGLELTSPDNALAAYTKLRSVSHLSLGIERNGQRTTLEYSIR